MQTEPSEVAREFCRRSSKYTRQDWVSVVSYIIPGRMRRFGVNSEAFRSVCAQWWDTVSISGGTSF
ncbi:hypothetical protein P692DRAFT_20594354 [Suillus brevipes Sb2]|nr:hypothetical protein P692DRAFT_20594354 [Suillus brevipes Sb2]